MDERNAYSIRRATPDDVPAAARIYEALHDEEAAGRIEIGWLRGVYPTEATAAAAAEREELFVLEEGGAVLGAAIINRRQVDVYAGAPWEHAAADDEACVLHTLVIDPACGGRGYGKAFVQFYENYARKLGLRELRMDTNARNERARAMYRKLGYREIGIVPTTFNGIAGVDLVLLEKYLT